MRSWGRRGRWVLTHLTWNGGEPDPRVLQSSFAMILVAAVTRTLAAEARARARAAELAATLAEIERNRSPEDVVALLSHELRTPLTPIIGHVSMALENPDLDPVLRKHLEVVARCGQRLERLVDDLLVEVGQPGRPVPLSRQPTDLATIIRDSVAAAEPTAVRAGIRLDAEVPERLAFTGDPHRLGQVVDHLVSNAIKYTESGGAARVSAAADAAAVVIRVRDTGIGIPEEDQAQLFTRFYRTSEATRRAIQGVGLGLSISKTIVESHGGLIELDSEPGRGSEFRVVLPLPVRLAS